MVEYFNPIVCINGKKSNGFMATLPLSLSEFKKATHKTEVGMCQSVPQALAFKTIFLDNQVVIYPWCIGSIADCGLCKVVKK